mmetsp:Transcript_27048/g.86976  ORF Transcript_27048/g.86976 Transcript_27048/m.86976 type:complete len:200 (-) Transcript_27048:1326-1925(-)
MPALSHPAPNSSGSGADSCASVALLHPAVMPRLLAFAGPSEFGALAGTASPLLFAALADSGRQRQLRSRWRNLVEPVHLAGPRPHPTDRTLQIATPDRAIVAAIRELLQSNEAGDLRESHRLLLDAFGRDSTTGDSMRSCFASTGPQRWPPCTVRPRGSAGALCVRYATVRRPPSSHALGGGARMFESPRLSWRSRPWW